MAERAKEPVSEFVRHHVERVKVAGQTYKDLAKQAGIAPSMISQLMGRTSDATFYTASRLAVPLGFSGLPALVNAAYAWWQSKGRDGAPDKPPPHREEAMTFALAHGVTPTQIERTLTRYPIEEFGERDAMWWLSRFHEERSLDKQIEALEKKALPRIEKQEATKKKRDAQASWRGRSAAKRAPKVTPAVPKRKRKAG